MDKVMPELHRGMFATDVQAKSGSTAAELAAMGEGSAIVDVTWIFGGKTGVQAQVVTYSATMRAVTGMTVTAAPEAAGRRIRMNAVAPGAVTDTQFMRPIMGRDPSAGETRSFGPLHALGRTRSAREVDRAILLPAPDDASFVTGEIVKVDGRFLNG
jgi:NAD(P)-dependent dehydrogenase (short-subunit alcohol dehydrogenase family)